MKLKTIVMLLLSCALARAGQQYDLATEIAPCCIGYNQAGQCAAFAKAFSSRLTASHIENRKVHFAQRLHGQTLWHVAVFFHGNEGWWYEDNIVGPILAGRNIDNHTDEILYRMLQDQGALGYHSAADLIKHGASGAEMPSIEPQSFKIDCIWLE